MPLLGNAEKLEKIVLPSTSSLPQDQQAWVVMDVSANKAGDYYNVDSMTAGHMTFAVLQERIREWNYQDAQGQTVPITVENLKRLNRDDFAFLQTKISDGTSEKMSDDQKKTSSDTSSPPVKDTPENVPPSPKKSP